MMEISSSQNTKLKRLKKLKSKKYRDRFGEYLLEGFKSIELALTEQSTIDGIYLEKTQFDRGRLSFLDQIDFPEDNIFIVEDELLQPLYETESPQGVLAVAKKPSTDFDFLWDDSLKQILFLDRVQDPGNLGTIIRTAEAAGYDLVVCGMGCADLFNPKTIRSTMGSVVTMKVACEAKGDDVLPFLKGNGFYVISAALNNSVDYRSMERKQPHVLILGNEGSGIREEILEQSDKNVKIPMHGKVESLNVSIAAGILLYHFGEIS